MNREREKKKCRKRMLAHNNPYSKHLLHTFLFHLAQDRSSWHDSCSSHV